MVHLAITQSYGYKPIANLNEYEQNQIRDLYVREMIFNINDKVDYVKEDIQGTKKEEVQIMS